MVIEKVYGIKATSITLNERFSAFAKQAELAARIREAKKKKAILANLRPNEVRGVSMFHQVPTQNFNGRQVARRSRPYMRRGVGRGMGRGVGRGVGRGMGRGVGRGNFAAGQQRYQSRIRLIAALQRSQMTSRGRASYRGMGRGRGRGQGRGRGIGRGGLLRAAQKTFTRPPVPSKEQLDQELDKYMSSSKHVLDKQLDEYMSEACNDIVV